ncbi:Planctomycete cytochrome C [Rosistilla carotiformis]|uniref:Planctomycete cytochrome C n=1 Tax=Rosistilla carotiformis TaxID=2528017 RepID=A0A518K0U8_9BACT|nr:PSD1 and planctomycete cytochrome C domain-containing protein [Rosistilla carotiformis]QDV71411.1 Planctomycete cytochrome C [Rosistilla carotiformis]
MCVSPRSIFKIALLLISATDAGMAIAAESNPPTGAPSPADVEYFERKIRPLLHEHCFECHAADSKTLHAGLRLDSRSGMLQGGDSGPSVVPGKPDESLLISSIHYNDYEMPPKGKLSDRDIAELTNWVSRGAPFPAAASDDPAPAAGIDIQQGREFWSFQPLKESPLPEVANAEWPQQRIDWFVLAAQEAAGLQPADEADRRTLLRRLAFDLTGLPPTLAQQEQFVSDNDPEAYHRLVTDLMQSPAYGERWGRVWLDLARYTDATASWLNQEGKAHLYRDWVVRAMNDDMPYDEFVRRQLATDMIPETGPDDIAALGFLGLSPTYWKELQLPCEIIKVIVADEWEERIDAISRTFLGLTVACARCHDHKFDPITTEDYYALAGVIASSRLTARPLVSEEEYEPIRLAKEEVARLGTEIKALKKKKPLPKEEIDKLTAERNHLATATPGYSDPLATAVSEESLYVVPAGPTNHDGTRLDYKPGSQDLNLFIRGNPNRLGPIVPRRFLSVLSSDEPTPFQQGSGRLELADSITRQAAPLTARVIVNRIWLAHFGSGLVSTPSNFGQLGERPTHPELLDDLAARFVANGWSLKWLHREIVMSATYRQSSRRSDEQEQIDPDNRWLGRMNRRRLDIEAWRDAMLTASGQLDVTTPGESVSFDDNKNHYRTMYSTIHRRDMSKGLQLHDFPDPNGHSPQRIATTTALQGLYLLNSSFVAGQADALAARIVREAPGDLTAQIDLTHRLLFGRPATADEIELATEFLADQSDDPTSDVWRQYAHAVLGCNEFLFVD